ncbi:MAG: NlpC/P60 family protein [Bacteroidota bacterium]
MYTSIQSFLLFFFRTGVILLMLNGITAVMARPYPIQPSESSPELPPDEASDLIDRIIENAESYMGVRYCYGGTSRSCTDCSGLLMNAFRQAGYPLLRTSRQQVTQGRYIDRNALKRGDLVFFGTKAYISHVAIVVESRRNYTKILHASSGNGKVAYDVLERHSLNRKYVTARRIIETDDDGGIPIYVDNGESDHTHTFNGIGGGKACSCGFDMPSFEAGKVPGQYPYASERLLSASELRNMSNRDLKIMRNEIFARKGYRFQTMAMRNYFRSLDWYQKIPKTHCNKSIVLSGVEKQNLVLIRSFEDG